MRFVQLVLLLFFTFESHGQSWSWVRAGGTAGKDFGTGIASCPEGHVLVTGYFDGRQSPFTLDDGEGDNVELFGEDFSDVFLARFDQDGRLIWARSAGGFSSNEPLAISVDGSGQALIVGKHRGTMTFGEGERSVDIAPLGLLEMFVAKYDIHGDLLWAQGAGSPLDDAANAVDVDISDNVYVAGNFDDAIKLGQGDQEVIFPSRGSSDIFIAKYDPQGTLLWAQGAGGNQFDTATALSVDGSEALYVAGSFKDEAFFGQGTARVTVTSSGDSSDQIFLARYALSGELEWVRTLRGAGSDLVHSIAVGSDGAVYLTGQFLGDLSYNAQEGGFAISSRGGLDAYLVKFDSTGLFHWAEQIGGRQEDAGTGLAVNDQGHVILSGFFSPGTVLGRGDRSIHIEEANDLGELFVAAYDSTGDLIWTRPSTSLLTDNRFPGSQPRGLSLDPSFNILVTGVLQQTHGFDGVEGPISVTRRGEEDVFIGKIKSVEQPDHPFILRQPQPFTVAQGEDAELRVLAYGAPPLQYQWHFQDQPLEGETSHILQRPLAEPAMRGLYHVTVSNEVGLVQSQEILLHVLDPPVILSEPVHQLIHPGDTVELKVEAIGGVPLSYQWYFNESLILGANQSVYRISEFRVSHAGSYHVEVSNNDGLIQSKPVNLVTNEGGMLFWRKSFDMSLSDPAMDLNGVIYVIEGLEKLHAVEPTGRILWTHDLTGSERIFIGHPVVGPDGRLHVFGRTSTASGVLMSFNPDGTLDRSIPVAGRQGKAPAVAADGTLFLAVNNENNGMALLYAIHANGDILWTFETQGNFTTSPVIGNDGLVFVCEADTGVFAFNRNGEMEWNLTVEGSIQSEPALGLDGTLYVGSYQGQLNAVLYAISPLGEIKWTYQTGQRVSNTLPVITADGTVCFGTETGRFLAVDQEGNLKWSFQTGGSIYGAAAIGEDGVVYILSHDRHLYALNRDGNLMWSLPIEHQNSSSLLLSHTGLLIFTDVYLHAVTASSGPARVPWPMFQRDPQRSGQGLQLPEVLLTQPIEQTLYSTDSSIPLSVEAASANGDIQRVDYYLGNQQIARAEDPPFAAEWTDPSAGIHDITAKAIDVLGATGLSNVVRIEVVDPEQSPEFILEPVDVTTENGMDIQLTSRVTGSPPITYQWFKDNEPMLNENDAALSLTLVGPSDSARYWVTAENRFGIVTSKEVVVNVLQPIHILWKEDLPVLSGTPAIDPHQYVHTPTESGGLYRLNAAGQIESSWREAQGLTSIRTTPLVDADGAVYIATTQARLIKLDETGRVIWKMDLQGTPTGSPALDRNGTVYVATAGGGLNAVLPSGFIRWQFDVGGQLVASPVIGANGNIHVGTMSGMFHTINPRGGRQWVFEAEDEIRAAAAIGSDGTLYFGDMASWFYALHPDGSLKWKVNLGGPISAGPAIGPGEIIYVGSDGLFDSETGRLRGKLIALNPDGSFRWAFETEEAVRTTPAISSDGSLYFGSHDGRFYALNPNGTLQWSLNTGGRIESSPVIRFDGVVYLPSRSALYAVKGGGPLADSAWPMFQKDARHTGNAGLPYEKGHWRIHLGSNQFDERVRVMTEVNGKLLVAGDFLMAGGVDASRIAQWDGHQWQALGEGLNGPVLGLTTWRGNTIAVGEFTASGDISIPSIGVWDGKIWRPLGDELEGRVVGVAATTERFFVIGNDLQPVVAGASGMGLDSDTPPQSILQFYRGNWSRVGNGLTGRAMTVATHNGLVWVGGEFLESEGISLGSLAMWNGQNWTTPVNGTGFNNKIRSLLPLDDNLYVGGEFTSVNGIQSSGIVRWDGDQWHHMRAGLQDPGLPYGLALASDGESVFIDGPFTRVDGIPANRIARWDGEFWHPLGRGFSQGTNTMVMIEAMAIYEGFLYAGGVFHAADDVPGIRFLARWDGDSWQAVGPLFDFRDGQFRLTLTNQIGRAYRVEASSDLIHWETVSIYDQLEKSMSVLDNNPISMKQRFYQAVLLD